MVIVQPLLGKLCDLLPGVLLGLLVVLEVEHRFLGAGLLVSGRVLVRLLVLALRRFLLLRSLLRFGRLGLVAVAVVFRQIFVFAQIHVVVVVIHNNFSFVLVHAMSSCIWLW